MKTFDEAMEAARDRRPFSNNSEWEVWSYHHCDDCRNEPTCPLVLVALNGKTPQEWAVDAEGELGDCAEFEFTGDPEDPGDPPPAAPDPVPVADGQLDLFGGGS